MLAPPSTAYVQVELNVDGRRTGLVSGAKVSRARVVVTENDVYRSTRLFGVLSAAQARPRLTCYVNLLHLGYTAVHASMSISQDSAATIVCKEIFDGASNPSDEGTWTIVYSARSLVHYFFTFFLLYVLDRCSTTGWFSSLAADCHPHFQLPPPFLIFSFPFSLSSFLFVFPSFFFCLSLILGNERFGNHRPDARFILSCGVCSPSISGSSGLSTNRTTKQLISLAKG